MKFTIAFLFVSIFSISMLSAQPTDSVPQRRVVEVMGYIKNYQAQVVPFAHTVVKGQGRGTYADYWGYFYLPVYTGDTILFSSVGYRRSYHVVPEDVEGNIYRINVKMRLDTVMLREMTVYPWQNYEQFKEMFVAMKVPDEEYQNAMDNMALIMEQVKRSPMRMTAAGNHRYFMQQIADQKYTAGQLPQNNLLNPLAWMQFFQAIKNGDFKDEEEY